MTIKIIKEGKTGKFTKTCPYCGCEFEYEQEDIKVDSNEYSTYVICPCCGKHLHHNGYMAYYNNPNAVHISPEKGFTVTNYDSCPNKPNPKYTIIGNSPCDWYIKRHYLK